MRVRLRGDQVKKLSGALTSAGMREIGGQLFGEQLAPSDFQVTELTVQARPGTVARFFVDLIQAMRDAVKFFNRTGHRYTQFNYIGEWHSHPSFSVQPSMTDAETMRQLVQDVEFRGNFAVLMIVRLDSNDLNAGAWLFDPEGRESEITLEISGEE